MSPVGITQNSEQNPKSILADRNHIHHSRNPVEKTNEHSSLRVTFAKLTANKQSNLSSVTSVNPSINPDTKITPPGKTKNAITQGVSNDKPVVNPQNALKNDDVQKTIQYPTLRSSGKHAEDHVSTIGQLRKMELDKTSKQNSKQLTDWLANKKPKEITRSAETVNSTGKESTQSTDTAKRTHLSKSGKRIRKLAKPSVRSANGQPKRTKSVKKLRKSKKSLEVDKDLEAIKPAPLNAEYASELSKMSQILTAVSAYDVSASFGGGPATTGVPVHGRIRNTEKHGKDLSGGHSVHRPLSGDELKQLLSSITRVVSLHQLPVNEHNSNTGSSSGFPPGINFSANELSNRKTSDEKYNLSMFASKDAATEPPSDSVRKNKKKKRKIKNSSPFLLASNKDQATKSKTQMISSRSSKSRASVRKGRPKRKSIDRPSHRKSRNDDGSSVSSLEKDPAQNAAFLRKYFEESTRLANKKSSEDLINQNAVEEETSVSSKKKKNKKKNKKVSRTNFVSKKSSKRSSPTTTKKTSQQSLVHHTLNGIGNSDKKEKSKMVASPENGKIQHQSHTTWQNSASKSKTNNTTKGRHHRMTSNVSTTAVAGSPKPSSPLPLIHNQGDGVNIFGTQNIELDKIIIESKNPATVAQVVANKTKTTSPVENGSIRASRQDQFKNIEDVINSRFSANTTKMKSVWEKTPYQPMTHARFKDMVSKYGSPEATIALANAEQSKHPMQASTKIGTILPVAYLPNPTPGNLLTLPKPWEITEKLAEEANKDKTLQQLQGPPRYWPDSATTSTYNRLDFDYKYNMRKDARIVRKTLREDAIRNRPVTPNKDDYVKGYTATAPNEVVDALKFYRDQMKRIPKKSYF